MGAAENLAVHRNWAAAENAHDLSHLDDFIHADIELHVPGSDPIVGIDNYRLMMQANFEGLENFHSAVEDSFATDDRVVCRWRTTGLHVGDFMGFPATGKRIEFAGISLWEFDAGKARRGYAFPDAAALMTQLMSSIDV